MEIKDLEFNNQTMDNQVNKSEVNKKKESPFLKRVAELEKKVLKLERQVDIILKSLRR